VGDRCHYPGETATRNGYAFLLSNVKVIQDAPGGRCVWLFKRHLREVLGCEPNTEAMRNRWQHVYKNPLRPKIVDRKDAPCKDSRDEKEKVDFYADPFPCRPGIIWMAGPYLGTLHAVITKDVETGWTNFGAYRNEILDKNHWDAWFLAYKHIGMNWARWRDAKKPMPVAIAIRARSLPGHHFGDWNTRRSWMNTILQGPLRVRPSRLSRRIR